MDVCQDVGAWERIINNSLDVICTIDRNGYIINTNEAGKRILGYECEELIGEQFKSFVHPDDVPAALHTVQEIINGYKTSSFENRCIHKSGAEVHLVWSGVWSEEDEVILCIGRDVTEQKVAQQKLREKDERYRALVEQSSDMLALIDEEINYLFCAGPILKELGYQPEQLIGANMLDFIHPQDIPLIQESLAKVLVSEEYVTIPDFRFKDAGGEWKRLETTLSNQLDNPAVKALIASSRDITERVSSRLKLKESEQRFKSLFEHHVDMILSEDKDGVIVDVNAAVLSFFGIQKQDIVNRPFADFLPPEVIPVCNHTTQQALDGQAVRYEIAIPFEDKGLFTFDIAKIPVIVEGETMGVYSILRDVTEISQSNATIRCQAEKLNTIMESITDAFFALDRNWNFTYVNSEFERLLQKDRKELLGKNVWELYQDEFGGEFYRQYHKAVKTGQAVDFEAHFQELDMWLQVKAFPSEEGLSIFFDDITERVNYKQELEKLSLVASKTINGVIITDAEGVVEWVNEGFTKLTEYASSEVVGRTPASLLSGEETDLSITKRIGEKRKQGKPFKEEIVIYKKSGEKVWLLLDVTPVRDEIDKVVQFVFIQTDITFRKEAEVRQLQLTHDLFRQNQDLQQFNYMVSHNLRSPVASAMGLIDLLEKEDNGSDDFHVSLAYLKTIIQQLDDLLKELNNVLSVRDKKRVLDEEEVELAPVCRQVVAALQEPLRACGGKVFMQIGEGVSVRANKAYLHSIFCNLLLNAIKFRSPERSLQVNIKCFGNKDRGIILSFSDNGVGFDMKLAGDKVFKLYKRFHPQSKGRGMGLYLVKTHLEAIGGHIEVTSQVNVGTRFLLYLK